MGRAMTFALALTAALSLTTVTAAGTPAAEGVSVTSGEAALFDRANCITVYNGGAVLTANGHRLQGETLVLYARRREAPRQPSTSDTGWATLASDCAKPHRADAHRAASFRDANGVRRADHAFYDLETGEVRFHAERARAK